MNDNLVLFIDLIFLVTEESDLLVEHVVSLLKKVPVRYNTSNIITIFRDNYVNEVRGLQ